MELGFFRVENSSVLWDMFFYDVYWEMEDLTPKEKLALRRKAPEEGRNFYRHFLASKICHTNQCPQCKRISKVVEYFGNLLVAECPKKFVPKN